jgi:hypothetical protein
MEKVTYVPGRFSQLKLDDRSRVFVRTDSYKVKAYKMLFGVIPTKKIWEFQLPFYIRGPRTPSTLAIYLLDLVLESVRDCMTADELTNRLNQRTTDLLKEYVDHLGYA